MWQTHITGASINTYGYGLHLAIAIRVGRFPQPIPALMRCPSDATSTRPQCLTSTQYIRERSISSPSQRRPAQRGEANVLSVSPRRPRAGRVAPGIAGAARTSGLDGACRSPNPALCDVTLARACRSCTGSSERLFLFVSLFPAYKPPEARDYSAL